MAKLNMRQDVPVELTWDLSLIYKTEEDMYKDVEIVKELADRIEQEYKGSLNTAERINACLDLYQAMYEKMTLCWNYCDLAVSVDYYDEHNQERNNRVGAAMTEIMSRLSFISSELMEQDEAVIQEAIEQTKTNKGYLKDILREKPHHLDPATEQALSSLSRTFGAPSDIYNMAKLADMKFPSFTVDGKEYPLGYSLFEDDYEYNPDAKVRRAAFQAFSEKIRQYENVTAAAYNTQVTTEKTLATLRGYDSVFDYLLFGQKVTREMYDRQIDLITTQLAPHMRRYAALLKRVHKLDKMTFADLKIAVDPEYDPRVTIEESKEYIKKGLAILGDDYVSMVEEAYRDRWVDFAKNQGKMTGGFCASPYGKGSFILMSWNDRMADVFTLAHELGHAGHFRNANREQSIMDTDVSSYFVEAPSTCNELIMAHYLLKTSEDKRFRRWVLSSMIGHTYYHNFVTHLMEAAYQREVYKIIDAGGSVTADTLSRIFKETLTKFWGEDVEILPGAELTWMRQPHYYMGLYSYTYSAGLTVATQAVRRMEELGTPAVEDWKKVLKAGSTLDPIGLAALAGVDITTDEPLKNTIAYLGEIIDEIIRLTDELEEA